MSRTTNNIGGDCGEKSSVKVHAAPGGKSSFSLGWGSDEPTQTKSTIRKYNNQSSIFGGDAPVKTPLEEKKREEEAPTFGKMGVGRSTGNIGGDSGEKTSVRVAYAPGGQSSFSLGGDMGSQFDAPKKKENIKPSQWDQSSPPAPTKTSVKVHNPPGGKSSISFC